MLYTPKLLTIIFIRIKTTDKRHMLVVIGSKTEQNNLCTGFDLINIRRIRFTFIIFQGINANYIPTSRK